jgi:hypothetical protein
MTPDRRLWSVRSDGRRYVQAKAKGVGARALVFSTARRTPSLIVALLKAAM